MINLHHHCGLCSLKQGSCQRVNIIANSKIGLARDVRCSGIRLPGLLSSPTPVLLPSEALERVQKYMPPLVRNKFHAFYSSVYGGIVTDKEYMMVPIEDRLMTKGHGAFDMCLLLRGHMYNLEAHMDRFEASLARAGLEFPFGRRELMKIILHTAAASQKLNGFVRFWASGGRGTIHMSPKGGTGPALYVLVTDEEDFRDLDITKGWSVKTTPVPAHDPYFMSTLSNGLLPNVLATMDAEESEFDQAMFVDPDGYVLGGANCSVAIVTFDNELVVPPEEDILCGVTMQRIMEEIPKYIGVEKDLSFKKIVRRRFTVKDAQEALEVIVTGTTLPVMGVTHWDGVEIDDGTTGVNALAFNAFVHNDAEYSPKSKVHIEVPYGYLTGMKETSMLTV